MIVIATEAEICFALGGRLRETLSGSQNAEFAHQSFDAHDISNYLTLPYVINTVSIGL